MSRDPYTVAYDSVTANALLRFRPLVRRYLWELERDGAARAYEELDRVDPFGRRWWRLLARGMLAELKRSWYEHAHPDAYIEWEDPRSYAVISGITG